MKKDKSSCSYKKGGKVKKEVKVGGEKVQPRLDKPSAMKSGGKVKMTAAAGGGLGRLQKEKNAKAE